MDCFLIPGTEGLYSRISVLQNQIKHLIRVNLIEYRSDSNSSLQRNFLCLAALSRWVLRYHTNAIYSTQSFSTFGGKCGLGPVDTDTYGKFPGLSPSWSWVESRRCWAVCFKPRFKPEGRWGEGGGGGGGGGWLMHYLNYCNLTFKIESFCTIAKFLC